MLKWLIVFLISIPVWYDWERDRNNHQVRRIVFQFQYGTIERVELYWLPCLLCLFQFQYGTIESNLLIYSSRISFYISIPVWYDWEYACFKEWLLQITFQFQYGTIERLDSDLLAVLVILFQFQYGTIERYAEEKGIEPDN